MSRLWRLAHGVQARRLAVEAAARGPAAAGRPVAVWAPQRREEREERRMARRLP